MSVLYLFDVALYIDIFSLNIVQLSKPLKQKQLRHGTLHPPFYIYNDAYMLFKGKKIFIFNKIVCSNMHNIKWIL